MESTGPGTTGGTTPEGTTPPPAGGWTSTPPPAPTAGPAGFYYADVPNRIIAYIIDFVILLVIMVIIGLILAAIGLAGSTAGMVVFGGGAGLIFGLLGIVIPAAYFIYTWMSMRGTPGMRVLGIQIGNESDGATLTLEQSAIRWALLFGPYAVAGLIGAVSVELSGLLNLLALVWWIALLVTTAQSPTKQGLHDRYSRTVVVKAARAVG